MLLVEDIWKEVMMLEPTDPPYQLAAGSEEEVERVKKTLSLYKHRILKRNKDMKEMFGNYKLQYTTRKTRDKRWLLEISVVADNISGSLALDVAEVNTNGN